MQKCVCGRGERGEGGSACPLGFLPKTHSYFCPWIERTVLSPQDRVALDQLAFQDPGFLRLRSKARTAREPVSTPLSFGPGSGLQGRLHSHSAQAIAEISSTHLAALPERRVHLLPARLSSELLIAPASGKIITETDSCYLKSQQ